MKVLAIGASGLVGSRFVELSADKYEILSPDFKELDITSLESIRKYIQEQKPQVIVNFAAFTDVSAAESQRGNKQGLCWQINVVGVANLVSVIAEHKLALIHISTDMVFPGSKERPGPYRESDTAETDSSKLTWYGFSKAEAERLVGKPGTILRIIYPVRAQYEQKLDYLRKPLSFYNQGKLYPLFNDQQVSISFIDEISLTLQKLIDSQAGGVFHTTSSDLSTPWKLIKYLINKLHDPNFAPQISSIESVSNPVRYPKYGGLTAIETQKQLGIKYSSCEEIIDQLIKQGITA